MKLLLARHGETDWNTRSLIQGWTDTVLNEHGKEQARQLGEQIHAGKYSLARIYTSSLERARQTAAIVSQITGVPYTAEPGLEEMNLGSWEGKTWKQVQTIYCEEYESWHRNRRYERTPQGESYQDLLNRLLPALGRIVERETKDVLVVTHSACIMTLFSFIYGTPFEEMVKHYHTRNGGIYELEGQLVLEKMP